MNQRRNVVNGRPSGTDGSDFSYRMVVDSRYKKVAEGRSRLGVVLFAQGFVQFCAAVALYLSLLKGGTFDPLSVYSIAIFFTSLFIGELGRRRSRINFLKVYLFGSSAAFLISFIILLKRDQFAEILKDFSQWEASKLEVFNAAAILLGIPVQLSAVFVSASLIGNMAPAKRAS